MKLKQSRLTVALGATTLATALTAYAAPAPSAAPGPTPPPPNAARPAPAPAPAELPPPPAPGIVARVDGTDITREELVTLLMKRYGSAGLEQLVDQKIIEIAAAKQNIAATPKDLETEYEIIKLSQPQLIDNLEKQYGHEYLVNTMIKPNVLIKKIGETLVKVEPSDLDEIRASHILIPITVGKDPAETKKNDEDARKLAQQVLDEVKKPGANFADLAKKYSKDTGSAQNGGDLDYFGRGRMVGPFEDAAFAAKTGEIIGPVKTDYGYHIIKVVDRRDSSKLTPIQLEQKREQLILSKAREPIQQWISRQRQAAKVEKYNLDAAAKTASK